MLRGTHHDAQRNLKSGDLAPIDKKHYQKERWEVVGDGDLFVRCFRPQVIRLVREHLKAYREALPDRDAFCNALDEIRQHLLTEHFGVRYFSQDLQSVLDEWEESAWKGEPQPGLEVAEHSRSASRSTGEPAPRKSPGRPTTISIEQKRLALAAKKEGKTNKECAQILYDIRYPTQQQVKNVTSILRHFKKTQLGKG